MQRSAQDVDVLTTFDFGIDSGGLISGGSHFTWCVDSRDCTIKLRNIKDNLEILSTYYRFGDSKKEKFSFLTAKDFEFNSQRYLLVSLETSHDRRILAIYHLSLSKVICAFRVPFRVTQIEILVKNRNFIENNKNQTFLRNFDVSAVCGCDGGAVCLFDITPHELMDIWESDENSPLNVHWLNNNHFKDENLIFEERKKALRLDQIFGCVLNDSCVSDESFKYSMSNEQVTATIPSEYVRVTSLKYEKQIDSLLVGFNFGCFQIWNLKNVSIESSSGYGENSKPIVGFSLLQPQNDPKKCLYLMVAHSSVVARASKFNSDQSPSQHFKAKRRIKKSSQEEDCDEDEEDEQESFEIDNDDDEDMTSFILLYQIMFERCVNVFLNQNESYLLYEKMKSCAIVFDHEISGETLKCAKTNNLSDLNFAARNPTSFNLNELNDSFRNASTKIISVQTLSLLNDQNQPDSACVVWSLVDKSSSASVSYNLSIFNLDYWYKQLMPAKMKLNAANNIYFNNYSLSIYNDLNEVKLITIVDYKIKRSQNRRVLNGASNLNRILNLEDGDEFGPDSNKENVFLSINFDLIAILSFSINRLCIKPVEQQIQEFISKQDLVHCPDLAFSLLSNHRLIDKYLAKNNQPTQPQINKLIVIFDYLFEHSQVYVILESLRKLNVEDTSIISSSSLKVVLDWSWNKVSQVKRQLDQLYKLITSMLNNYLDRYSNHEIEPEHLAEFLQQKSNLLENLIRVFRQFLQLNSSPSGKSELSKKLSLIECLKFYVEHLTLFHKFELLLPPKLSLSGGEENESDEEKAAKMPQAVNKNRNYLNEMSINLKIIKNRWMKRREEQVRKVSNHEDEIDRKYPFTYIIDCLIEECKSNSKFARFLSLSRKSLFEENQIKNMYPPTSINELLEICLETNLTTRLKQIVILYVLCDLMHTEVTSAIQKHLLKLINAYCSTTFTTISASPDSKLGTSWSSFSAQVGLDSKDPNSSSSLFDLVNGFYLIDSQNIERAFKYLKNAELSYLETYEKYFVLYNSLHLKEYKLAIEYLWLFQKLNTASIATLDLNASSAFPLIKTQSNDASVFRFFSAKNTANINLTEMKNNFQVLQRNEQNMHLRVIITIYLANSLLNEAYEFIRHHLKQIKFYLNNTTLLNNPAKLSKEIVLHFLIEADKFDLIRQVCRLSSLDQDLLFMLVNYLEAKQDLFSIVLAINLHVDNRNYSRAIFLYEKHNRQIMNSEYEYLSSMIDVLQSENTLCIESTKSQQQQQTNFVTLAEIKEASNFEYKFSIPLSELCKYSKRCVKLLDASQDYDYISLMKLPEEVEEESGGAKPRLSMTPSVVGFKVASALNSSMKKRKCSTPHHEIAHSCKKRQTSPSNLRSVSKQATSEAKSRVLTSVLRISRNSNSVTKSVKFNASKYTRRITMNEKYEDREEEVNSGEDNSAVERKKLFAEDDEAEPVEKTVVCHEGEKTKIVHEEVKNVETMLKISASIKLQTENIEKTVEIQIQDEPTLKKQPEKEKKEEEMEVHEKDQEKKVVEEPVEIKQAEKQTEPVGIEETVAVQEKMSEQKPVLIPEPVAEQEKMSEQEPVVEPEAVQETATAEEPTAVHRPETMQKQVIVEEIVSEMETEAAAEALIEKNNETMIRPEKAQVEAEKKAVSNEVESVVEVKKSQETFEIESKKETSSLFDFVPRPFKFEQPEMKSNEQKFDSQFKFFEFQKPETQKKVSQLTQQPQEKNEQRAIFFFQNPRPEPKREKKPEKTNEAFTFQLPFVQRFNFGSRFEFLTSAKSSFVPFAFSESRVEARKSDEAKIMEEKLFSIEEEKTEKTEVKIIEEKEAEVEEMGEEAVESNEFDITEDATQLNENVEEIVEPRINEMEVESETKQETDKIVEVEKSIEETKQTVEKSDESAPDMPQITTETNEENNSIIEDVIVEKPESEVIEEPKVDSVEKVNEIKEEIKESPVASSPSLEVNEEFYVQSIECQTSMLADETEVMEKTVVAETKEDSVLERDLIDSSLPEKESKANDSIGSASIELNLSSVSMSITDSQTPVKEASIDAKSPDFLPSGKMSRQSSSSSIFSHISSVSQQTNQSDDVEEVVEETGSVRRRGRPKRQIGAHMDDNELSVTKKASEQIDGGEKSGPGKSSIKRIRSDLTSSRKPKSDAVAKLKANLQKIPENFGANENEIRVTRSKLKALVEENEKTPVRSSARISKSSTKKVETDLNNETKSAKMSISNLRKFDKMLAEKEEEKSEFLAPTPVKTARSPSPSASSCVSTSTVQSITSSAAGARKRPKARKEAAEEEEKTSPSTSVISVASSTASATRKRGSSNLKRSDSFDTAEQQQTPVKNYNLRSKGRGSSSAQKSSETEVKVARRGRPPKNPINENLNKIQENLDSSYEANDQ